MPTMFIVDKAGKVAGAVTTENLEEAVKTLLLGESLDSAARQGAISAPVAR